MILILSLPSILTSIQFKYTLVNPAQVTSAQFGQTVLPLKLKIS